MSNPKTHTVEAQIREVSHRAAKLRCQVDARELPAVAREILIRAASNAKPTEDRIAHPVENPAQEAKVRVRFRMPVEQHQAVKAAIRDSGQSMTRVIEEGLEEYARTGQL